MPLQIAVGAFLYQNVPTLCLLFVEINQEARRHILDVLPGRGVYEYSVFGVSGTKIVEFPGYSYFHIFSPFCRQINDDNYEDSPR